MQTNADTVHKKSMPSPTEERRTAQRIETSINFTKKLRVGHIAHCSPGCDVVLDVWPASHAATQADIVKVASQVRMGTAVARRGVRSQVAVLAPLHPCGAVVRHELTAGVFGRRGTEILEFTVLEAAVQEGTRHHPSSPPRQPPPSRDPLSSRARGHEEGP